MRQILSFGLAAVIAASSCALPVQSAQAQQSDNRVSLNFVDTDIPAVLRALSVFTQRNFLVDPRVKGKITLVSERPVSRDQALSMLTGALRLQGFAIVDVDGVTRVVPEADGKLQGSPVVTDGPRGSGTGRGASGSMSMDDFARGSQMVTRVFSLKYENAANLVPVLRPMVPPNNPINAYPGNNTLVITDYADNLERIAQVIARIDVASSMDTDVVPIEYGIASDIAALASQLMDGQGAPGQGGAGADASRIAIVADPRSNSVVIRSGNPARTRLARDLIAKLDARQKNAGNLHVVYLRNAQATRIAHVLGGLLNGQSQTQSIGTSGPGAAGAVAGAGTGLSGRSTSSGSTRSSSRGFGGNNASSGLGSSNSGGLGSNTQQISREDPNDASQPVSYAAGGAVIQADPSTNTLIISAPEPLYRSLREVIDQLDQRRAQVLVESMIVEVNANSSSEFGIQWMTGGNGLSSGRTSFIGGTNLGGSGITATGPTTLDSLGSGLSLGLVKGTVDVLGNQVINLGVLARALQDSGQANILSTPNLLTLDNEQASILVGQTVPFVTGSYVTSGSDSTSNPFQTVEREDIGLKLNIRPQISEGGAVKLDIYQEVSSIDDARSNATTGIVTNKRAIDTSVLIDDGQIIVLGGLLEDSMTISSNNVPGLSNIPLLGALFRYDSRQRTKTNLMVFLRPYVLRDSRSSANVTLDRYDYMRRAQSNAQPGQHWLLPDMQGAQLPPANVPVVGERPYDMRPEHVADTMRRPGPMSSQSTAVRQMPQLPGGQDEANKPIRASLPLGVSVARDPTAIYGQADTTTTTLQIASVNTQEEADQIVKRVQISGLNAYSRVGPGGLGVVVRAAVARDATTVDTSLDLLRQLGFKPELVTNM
ncbi:general secretion pathway protein D [Bordetella ansorpii]|uniref:General secretion pathway protein D n=1 Tax=Bordetella ansorpii TaxID=288768 RepID=A0A157SLY4_9BORD|nr:type II secretion system secretin GspD [Bordetella ansorpii]SAI71405.1 general secretion pathway protein D [Bordetella ansorpii]